MTFVRQIIAAFLFLVFLISASPKELLHEFFHEHESADFVCEEGCGDHLSSKHEHCEVLQLSHPPLYFFIHSFGFNVSEMFYSIPLKECSAYCFSSSPFLFFRGPPALI